MYLLLASFQLPRIDVGGLEVGKEQLDGRGGVAVRASEDDRHLLFRQVF